MTRRATRRRTGMLAAAALGAATVLLVVTHASWRWTAAAWLASQSASRLELDADALSPVADQPSWTVYLVVGTDRRNGQPRSLPAMGSLSGERADSITLWVVHPDRALAVLALPRDLRVQLHGHGDCKLGATLEFGAASLITAVRNVTGLPVHHYVEVTFEGFARLVTAVGGVDIVSPAPLRDRATHLAIQAGTIRLDGATALSYVRARSVESLQSGRWVAAGTGDLGRIDRQQLLLTALADRLRQAGPLTLARVAMAARSGIAMDHRVRGTDLALVAATVAGGHRHAVQCTLPSRRELLDSQAMSPFPPAHDGSAVFRVPDTPAAAEVLQWIGSAEPTTTSEQLPVGCRRGVASA